MSATDKAKFDCPTGYVICENSSSDLDVFDWKMTFTEAQIHCKGLNSTICKSPSINMPESRSKAIKANSVSPLNFEEIKNLIEEKNLTDEQYIIWTDFERVNLTHFRISDTCRHTSTNLPSLTLVMGFSS